MELSKPNSPFSIEVAFFATLALLFTPLILMIVGSFIFEGEFSLHWYLQIFADNELLSALGRSLQLGFFSSLFSTLLGCAASIALYQSTFRWKKLLNSFSILALVLPELVFALSLLSWFFILRFELGLLAVLIAHISFSLSFSIFLISSRLRQLDESLQDAARDLGAGEWTILRTVTLPLLMPAIRGSFVLCFLLSFDDFLISYFVSGVGADTLPIRLYTGMKAGHTPKLNALATLMTLLTICTGMTLFFSRNFRKSIVAKPST